MMLQALCGLLMKMQMLFFSDLFREQRCSKTLQGETNLDSGLSVEKQEVSELIPPSKCIPAHLCSLGQFDVTRDPFSFSQVRCPRRNSGIYHFGERFSVCEDIPRAI